jgi:hypothetical protein
MLVPFHLRNLPESHLLLFQPPSFSLSYFFVTCEIRQSTSDLMCTTYRRFTASTPEISRSVKTEGKQTGAGAMTVHLS